MAKLVNAVKQYDTLFTNIDTVIDPLTTTVSYNWLRNGIQIPNATTDTYTLTQDDVGTLIKGFATLVTTVTPQGSTTPTVSIATETDRKSTRLNSSH